MGQALPYTERMGYGRICGHSRAIVRIQAVALALLVMAPGVLLSRPNPVHACTAPPPPWPPYLRPRDYVPHADVIFVGQVISTSQVFPMNGSIYSATVEVSTTLKGVISSTQVSVGGFGPSGLCYTEIVARPDSLIFFARGSALTQLSIVYLLSGPRNEAGVFPATPGNLNEVQNPFWLWLPLVRRL